MVSDLDCYTFSYHTYSTLPTRVMMDLGGMEILSTGIVPFLRDLVCDVVYEAKVLPWTLSPLMLTACASVVQLIATTTNCLAFLSR